MQFFHKIVNAYCSIVEANIIHRDLKPANILLSKEKKEPYIIDFGYSQIILANRNMTVFNVGSPSYMAPEAYLKTIYS
jgi:serine/threonine-protein kinase